jgi:ketosteroid isomerase-like protein
MTPRPDRELLKQAYRAFNAREIDAVLALMQPDVDWPNAMEGRREIGHANVREYWRRQFEVLDPQVEPVGFSDDGAGRTVVDVHQVVKDRTGKVLVDQIVQHIYSFRDGLIERMEIRELQSV